MKNRILNVCTGLLLFGMISHVKAMEDPKEDLNKAMFRLIWRGGKVNKIRELIERGADVNVKGQYGVTPLHKAASTGDVKVVQLLLDYGAKIDAEDSSGDTPLHVAAANWNNAVKRKLHDVTLEVAGLLLEKGAKVNKRNRSGMTPLYGAIRTGEVEIIKLLLEKGADVEARDEIDNTPLCWAASNENVEAIELLLKYGANLKVQNGSKRTPLHYAASRESKVVQAIIDWCTSDKTTDKYVPTMQELLEIKDKDGNTAYQVASGEIKKMLKPFLKK